jgi:uncharacterized protein (TIGR04255 family)
LKRQVSGTNGSKRETNLLEEDNRVSAPPDLPNKPLIEALVEIKWSVEQVANTPAQVDRAYPLFIGSLHERLRRDYPTQQRLPAANVPDEFTPYVPKFQFRPGQDKWPVVQVGPGLVTLNMTDDYSWAKFQAEATRLWGELDATYRPYNDGKAPSFSVFSLRFINQSPLNGLTPLQFLREKLHIDISLPVNPHAKHVADEPESVILSVAFPMDHPGSAGTIQTAVGNSDGVPALRWELIVEANTDRDPAAVSDFTNWLDLAHEAIEDWFLKMSRGDLYDSFLKGGK